MNKTDYDSKVNEHLSDESTYEKISNDPNEKVRRAVNKKLMELKNMKKITY